MALTATCSMHFCATEQPSHRLYGGSIRTARVLLLEVAKACATAIGAIAGRSNIPVSNRRATHTTATAGAFNHVVEAAISLV